MSLDGQNDVKRVQEATDLVRLIGEHVRLKSAGREMVGLCPFHSDKSPSMRVSPQKQIFKCFACGAGGDCFSFMMKYHRMEFREALQKLAERAGITLTPFRGQKAEGGHLLLLDHPGLGVPQRDGTLGDPLLELGPRPDEWSDPASC